MKLKDLLTEEITLNEHEMSLLETNSEELTEEQLNEKQELMKSMLSAALKIPTKFISTITSKYDTYEITLSNMCSKMKTLLPDSKCIADIRDKLLSSKFLKTYDVTMSDDIIRIAPIMNVA